MSFHSCDKAERNIAILRWESDEWVKQTVITPLPSHQQSVQDATKIYKVSSVVTVPQSRRLCNFETWTHAFSNAMALQPCKSWLPPSSPASARSIKRRQADVEFNVDAKSYRRLLPPSTAASPNESKRKRLTLNLMLMQNPAAAKSYRSWLPPSSGPASRARLLADKASSSSSKSPKLKPMPKQRAKSAMERRNGPIRCKCLPKAPFQLEASGMWSVFQRYLQLSYGKPLEKTMHSELPITATRRSAPTVVAVAYGLPVDQTAWSLSLCSAKLLTRSRHDRFKAVKQRTEECHEGESLRASGIVREPMSKSKATSCRTPMPSAARCSA